MIPTVGESSVELFKYIGQILKAYVQQKISNEMYLIRFFKKAILVKSSVDLKEGEQIFLKVESLSPNIVLKKVPVREIKETDEKASIFRSISKIEKDYPQLRSLLRLLSDPRNTKERLFWENLKDLFLLLKKSGSSKHLSFISSVNQHLEGIYIQLPFSCFIRDTEFFFSFKSSKKSGEKCIIRIRVELSRFGPVDVLIEDNPVGVNIMFGVTNREVQKLFMKQIHLLHDILKRDRCIKKEVSIDCKVLPKGYLEVPLSSIVSKEKEGMNLFV